MVTKNKVEPTPIRDVGDIYNLRNEEQVARFLEEHRFLRAVLSDAYPWIQKHFPGSQAFLELLTDPEECDRALVVSVATDLPAAEAVPRLEQFKKEWWLPSLDRAQGQLFVKLEFR